MKTILAVIAVSVGALGAAACESDGYYDGGFYDGAYYDRGPQVVWHDGWYDNYYGPIYDGYWGPRDVFFYRLRPGDRFYRDDYRHFRRGEFRGGVRFRYEDDRRRGRGRY